MRWAITNAHGHENQERMMHRNSRNSLPEDNRIMARDRSGHRKRVCKRSEGRTSKALLLGLLIVAAGFIGGTAHAHPVLETTDPGPDATVASPKEIRLTFTEDVVAKFSGLTVKDQSGHPIETASPSVDPNHKRQLVAPIAKPLPPGNYDVEWHAVSVDTHRVTGHFSFRVGQ